MAEVAQLLPNDLEEARKVLDFEAHALQALSESLGEEFTSAVEEIENATGRVIITGMGKSGHVACKIAATFASTGTPAFFVHPGEASHGDLGMISKGDVVLALSNSGETAELFPTIAYVKRYSIPLISMTSNGGSTLAQAAQHSLVIPKLKEACPIGLAPTTSTTMMMALGDALAAALLKRYNFSAEDFRVFHPGGALGKKLKTVADIMHTDTEMPLVTPNTLMSDALLEMTSKRFGCIGVIDSDKNLLGIVTDGDLRRHMGDSLLSIKVEDVMTQAPQTIRPNALIEEAVATMNERKITSLFVMEEETKTPLGIFNIHDCLRAD